MTKIMCIIADNNGNKLWLKDLRIDKNKIYIKYKSTFNDVPFFETEIYNVDGGQNYVITGGNGTILFRFSKNWIDKLNIINEI